MKTTLRRTAFVLVAALWFMGAGCAIIPWLRGEKTWLDDGFYVQTYRYGHDGVRVDLRHKDSGLIWPEIRFSGLADCAISHGDMAVCLVGINTMPRVESNRWYSRPAVFAVKKGRLPVDITAEVVRRWAAPSEAVLGKEVWKAGIVCLRANPNGLKVCLSAAVPSGTSEELLDRVYTWDELEAIYEGCAQNGTKEKDPLLKREYIRGKPMGSVPTAR